jgi:protein gp37
VFLGQEYYRATLKAGEDGKVLPKWSGIVKLMRDRLDIPRRWRKPCMIFVDSMSDLLHESVPDDFIDEVFDVIEKCPRHTFQVLTKRARRMKRYMQGRVRGDGGIGAPDNAWIGVSVEDQKRFEARVPHLLATPAKVRWLSCEPLLGPLDRDYGFGGIDWVVVGGESGPGNRPMEADWACAIRDQCLADGVPFLFKQWGGARPGGDRHLDSIVWDQYPETKP